jgi:predicted permease
MWHRLKALLLNLTHKFIVEDDLTQELNSYQAMLADENSRAGMDRSAAIRAARLEMEGLEQIKENVRDVRLGVAMETFFSELRQSIRSLSRNKDLTILCTTILALSIGATTVVFSIFYAALVQPLPFRDPAHLVELKETRVSRGIDRADFSEANFWDVRAQNHSFEEVAAFHYDEANLTGDGPAEKVTDRFVTAGFFRTLGVSPVLGRDFSPGDDDRNGFDNGVVILGNKFWKSRFSADPNIVGKTLHLNNRACVVVGVLPPGEPWINDQVYQPFGHRSNANRSSLEFSVIGRILPGVSLQGVQADLNGIASTLDKSYPGSDQGIGFLLKPASSWIAHDNTRRALWVLAGAVSFLLLIACLNIANLLLARGTARQREIAVRIALGAGRARLIRFVMMESLLLSLFGTLLGLALAFGSIRGLQTMHIQGIPRLADAGLNPWVLWILRLDCRCDRCIRRDRARIANSVEWRSECHARCRSSDR